MKPRMKLRIKLTRSSETKQVTFTTNRSNVLTGTCVGAQDYYLELANGRSIDISELAIGMIVNLVFPHSNYIAKSVADGYKMYGDDNPFITMVIECKIKEPTAEDNIIIMEDDIDSVYYEACSSDDTLMNEGDINILFQKVTM
jgi:hypothetical protein